MLVLLDRCGRSAVQPFLEPVFGRVPDSVVRPGSDARFEVAVKRLEPVLDRGLGLAGDLAPDPPPVRTEPEADYTAPPALAVSVPVAVTARSVVLEEDPVFAPAAS